MEFGSVGRGLGAVLQPGMTPLIMLLIKRCQSSAGRLAARSRFETARRKPANMSVMPLPRHALKMLTLRDDSDQCSVSGSTLLSRRVALGCVVLGPKRMPCAYVLPHSEKKSLSGRNRPSAPDCVMSWSARWREAVRRANRRARPRGCTTAKGALPGRISPRTRIASQTTAHQSCLRGACTVEAERGVGWGSKS